MAAHIEDLFSVDGGRDKRLELLISAEEREEVVEEEEEGLLMRQCFSSTETMSLMRA